MGTISTHSYANITMGQIDEKLKALASSLRASDPLSLYKRFIDAIFAIWTDTVEKLERFLHLINSLHPTLKFTFSYTCPYPCNIPPSTQHDCFCYSSRSIPFLDTQVSIQNGQLVTDLHRKPTDRCMYLLPSSCHPAHTTRNIPSYSLCYRLVRICSERQTLLLRLEELKELLLPREYPLNIINSVIQRALLLSRDECLKKVIRKPSDRVVYVTTYHPALPSYTNILTKAWKIMSKDNSMKEVFPKPPMVAYKQPRNSSLQSLLIKTKLPEQRTRRKLAGSRKCNRSGCGTYPFMLSTDRVCSAASEFSLKINTPVTCSTSNVVYCISCNKSGCYNIQYIGETGRRLDERFREHAGYVRTCNQS